MLKPLGNFIMLEQEKKTEFESGIVLAEDSAIGKPKGSVIDWGGDKEVRNLNLNIGDVVYFIEGSGEPLKDGDKEYLLMRPYDLLAVERI
ncbi:MAG: hypothetical protein WC346_17080 [Methanogenium sp.]|jgi:co-chaperonin GroES (HSP10)